MKRLSRSLAPSYLPAVIAAFVVLVAGILADNQNQVVAEARLRARVAEELNPIRAKLEANVNGNIQLVRGLIGTLVTEPGMDQKRFATLSRSIFTERSQLRSIAAARPRPCDPTATRVARSASSSRRRTETGFPWTSFVLTDGASDFAAAIAASASCCRRSAAQR